MEERRPQEELEDPEITLTADVRARELRFDEVPNTEVRFCGRSERDSVSETERENLPEEVERDVTYRDVRVRLRIASELTHKEPDFWEK